MNLYFFHNIEKEHRKDFSNQMVSQNFRVGQTIAISTFCLTFMIRFFDFVIDFKPMVKLYNQYVYINTYFTILGLCFAIIFFAVRTKVSPLKLKHLQPLLLLFAFLFISGCIWMSFIAQSNPKNTLSMLVLGMLTIAGLLIFSFAYTIFLALLSVIIFTYGLGIFQTDINLWMLNYLTFIIITIGFIVFSRLSYSSHVNHFLKVESLENANAEIQQVNQWKDEILSVVAHDLRSPLSNIQSLIELMNDPTTSEEERQIYINHIKTSCIKADFIIKEIIVAAQEEHKDDLQNKQPENLNVLLMDVHRTWQKVTGDSRTVQLILPKDEVVIPVYKGKLIRIIDNLINNAIKFTKEKQGVIQIELKKENNTVIICVRDNGIGIPPHLVPFLFDKFTSAGRNGLNNEPSVGLGLYISKQLMQKHGGQLTVETFEDKGSSFYIHLPV